MAVGVRHIYQVKGEPSTTSPDRKTISLGHSVSCKLSIRTIVLSISPTQLPPPVSFSRYHPPSSHPIPNLVLVVVLSSLSSITLFNLQKCRLHSVRTKATSFYPSQCPVIVMEKGWNVFDAWYTTSSASGRIPQDPGSGPIRCVHVLSISSLLHKFSRGVTFLALDLTCYTDRKVAFLIIKFITI
jgi:hypothetical protein